MNFSTNYNVISFASTKRLFSAQTEENNNDEKVNKTNVNSSTDLGTLSYAEMINNQSVVTKPKDDLYNAYWTIYQKDIEQSNIGLGKNEFANQSQLSFENSKKVITNENEAKEHLNSFLTKLVEELKNQGKYDTNMEEAFKFVKDNFRWDKYFEQYPRANANKLELIYLQALASASSKNEFASIFIVK